MKKIFYKNTKNYGYKTIYPTKPHMHYELLLLLQSFNETYVDFIIRDILEDNKTIIIWNKYITEESNPPNSDQCLRVALSNYQDLIQQWNKNLESPKEYLIVTQDDTGWIKLEAKDALSENDLAAVAEA